MWGDLATVVWRLNSPLRSEEETGEMREARQREEDAQPQTQSQHFPSEILRIRNLIENEHFY